MCQEGQFIQNSHLDPKLSLIVRVTIERVYIMVNSVPSLRFPELLNAMTKEEEAAIRARFGKHLVELRKTRGLSQEKLALESGLARSYIGGIERGKRNIALVNICVLAKTLEVAPAEMLNFELPATES
jgi:DNA-binding XRE family transcriptional regulator